MAAADALLRLDPWRAPSPRGPLARAIGTVNLKPVDWRRNLAALWACQFAAIIGVTAVYPFIALFLVRDLQVHSPRSLAIWAGLCTAAASLGIAAASPAWGVLADRVGRRVMLLRALIGGSAVVIVTAFCQTPLQLLLLRLGYGLLGGQRPIATSIVASETPRNQSARAQGILAMAVSLGSAIGPAAGGLVAQLVGMRATIALAGATVLVSSAGVFAWVRESPPEPSPPAGQPKSSGWRFLPPATRRILLFVFAGQALHMMSATMIIPLLAIRLLAVDPLHVGLTTGIAFGVSGAMTALAALALAPAVSRLGYRGTLPLAMLLSAATTAGIAALTSVTGIIAVFALYGFATGFLLPGASSVTALLTPRSVHGTVFGFTSTAQSGGATFGPLLGGLVGAAFGAQTGLFLAAAIFIGAAAIWVTGTREPDPADPT